MAKKFTYAPGVEILFERSTTVQIRLPSGKTATVPDEAPAILIVSHGDSTSYFCRDGEAWATVAEVNVGEIIGEHEAASSAARAPKF